MDTTVQSITTLHDLLDYDVRQFTSGEVQLRNSLSEWINVSVSVKLKLVLQKYLENIEDRIKKLEKFLDEEKMPPAIATDKVMQVLIDDLTNRLLTCTDVEIKDACLLAGIQTVNHFKISRYGTAATFANVLGMEKQAALFFEAEVAEKQIDDRLSQLAQFEINLRAKAPIVLPG